MIAPRRRYTLSLPDGRTLELGARTLLMGVVNVTPDSFADGGACLEPARALEAAVALEAAGADLLDVGGESTRPGAEALPAEVECARVLPVLDALSGCVRVPVSIDTYKAEVARRAIDAGASIINDISALRYDPAIARVAAVSGAPLVLMHSRGRSRAMYGEAHYADVSSEVTRELAAAVRTATAAGVARTQIIVDPGLGFAKRAEQTLALLSGLQAFGALDRPVLVGPSRKSFLTAALGERPPAEREWGTASAIAAAVLFGAHIVRVHAVAPHVDVVRVADSIRAHAKLQ